MVLLLLGLAIVLTTSSCLLAANGSGRGGDGSYDEQVQSNTAGEIAGSISITAQGELWLTVLIDQFSILARLDIVNMTQEGMGYRLSVAAVEPLSHEVVGTDGVSKSIEFSSPDEAASKVIELFDNMGMVFSGDSLRSIPHAISCGWKTPEDCKHIINHLLEEQSGSP